MIRPQALHRITVLLPAVLGILLAGEAAQASDPVAYIPDFVIPLLVPPTPQSPLTGISSNGQSGLHPQGELGFKFSDCGTNLFCLDLAIVNQPVQDLSSSMVAAAFDLPALETGLASILSTGYPAVTSYSADTTSLYNTYPDYTLRGSVFQSYEPSGAMPPFPSFDLCAVLEDANKPCLTSGKPEGLAPGEASIVRFSFGYQGPLTAGEIGSTFLGLYNTPLPDSVDRDDPESLYPYVKVAGRWMAIRCTTDPTILSCPDSDKIGYLPPPDEEPPVPPEESVPAPLPIVGAAVAHRAARRLRQRRAPGAAATAAGASAFREPRRALRLAAAPGRASSRTAGGSPR